MRIEFYQHQIDAIDKLGNGSILCGGVGTGKSRTALGYYYKAICGGEILKDGTLVPPPHYIRLVIITTARKRDTNDWEKEMVPFGMDGIDISIDSWNNISKYISVKDAFFIFDEQRVVGSGKWSKAFIRIAKFNKWILLSATPGDTWLDYIPVFVANGFYRNRTEFLREHAVYNRYSRYPKIDRFVGTGTLEKYRRQITVSMSFEKPATPHYSVIKSEYDDRLYSLVGKTRWDPYNNEPIQNIAYVVFLLRRVVNSDPSRLDAVRSLMKTHKRLIIFYNFDYELDLLRTLSSERICAEWNGHHHEAIPQTEEWLYLVQYTAGAEGWNCVETNAIIFYSQNYSYKLTTQAAGRIDRLNTQFKDLYYYIIRSSSPIDGAIARAIKNKRNFNESAFYEQLSLA